MRLLRRQNRCAVERPAIGCLGVAHHRAGRRHEVGLVIEIVVLFRAAPIAAPSLETLRQAGHGLAENTRLGARIALPEQCKLTLRETERGRERAHATSKKHEPRDEASPPGIDESEAARGDLQDHAAESTAETVMQRPARWHWQRGQRAGEHQQGERRDDDPPARIDEPPAQDELGAPEGHDDHAEDGRETDGLQQQVGKDGAERPHPVARRAACRVGQARIRG